MCDDHQLGNPVLEFATDFNSRAEYFWSHGLISDGTYRVFTAVCNYSRYVTEYYGGALSPLCARVMNQVTRETSRFVDKYDVTLDVCLASVLSQSAALAPAVRRPAGRRLRRGRDRPLPQPPRRAGGDARQARRRRQVGRLQQVTALFCFRTVFFCRFTVC